MPKIVKSKSKNHDDPFVIAKRVGDLAVSGQKHKKSKKKTKVLTKKSA